MLGKQWKPYLTDHGDLRSACFDEFSNTAVGFGDISFGCFTPMVWCFGQANWKAGKRSANLGYNHKEVIPRGIKNFKDKWTSWSYGLNPVIGSIKQSSKTLVRCDDCRKIGHLNKNCWKYQKDLKSKEKKTKSSKTQETALFAGDISESWSDEEEEFWQEFLYLHTAN